MVGRDFFLFQTVWRKMDSVWTAEVNAISVRTHDVRALAVARSVYLHKTVFLLFV